MKILVMFLLVGPIYENDGAVLNAVYQCGEQKTRTALTHNFVLNCRGAHVSNTSSLLIGGKHLFLEILLAFKNIYF